MKSICIITGASSGMGKEFSIQLMKTRPADEIWLIARRTDKLEEQKKILNNIDSSKKVKCITMDISGSQGVTAFENELANQKEEFTISTLVNNAGYGTYGTFDKTSKERQLGMIDINVYSLTGLCYASLPYLSKESAIINVASLASFMPLGNFAVYGATKAYVLSFSTALAAELLDKGIFVISLCPGPVDTEFANVASLGARPIVKNGKSPQKVVEHCLKSLQHKKHFAIYSLKWKFKAFMSHFVGRFWFARWTFINEKRPSN